MSGKTRIAVCVATYQRPKGLKRLIEGLNKLSFDKCETPDLEVIVVDNDSAGPAYAFCEGISSDLRWPLKCSVEPRRGISYARNRAVACAQEEGHVDFIAFIDDEVPEPSCLDELLYTQRKYDADVVAGPALPHFTVPVASWIEQGKFFGYRRLPTGDLIDWAATGNVLVRSEVFKKMDNVFDERLALCGGEDAEFFQRACRAGYKMMWADDALVYEWVPESRSNVRYILQRAYRIGNTTYLLKSEFEPTIAVRASLAAEASKVIAWGLLHVCRSLVVVPRSLVKTRRNLRSLQRKLRSLVEILRRNLRSVAVNPRSLVEIRRNLRSLAKILRCKLLRPLVKKLRRSLRPLVKIRRRLLVRSLRDISRGAGILAGVAGRRYEEYRRIHGD